MQTRFLNMQILNRLLFSPSPRLNFCSDVTSSHSTKEIYPLPLHLSPYINADPQHCRQYSKCFPTFAGEEIPLCTYKRCGPGMVISPYDYRIHPLRSFRDSQCFGSLPVFVWSGSGSSILGWYRSGFASNPGPGFWWPKIGKNLQLKKNSIFFWSKLQQKTPALKREHTALQNMKFLNFFAIFVGNFCPPGSGYGSTDLIESGLNPDLKHWRQQILQLAYPTKPELNPGSYSDNGKTCLLCWL